MSKRKALLIGIGNYDSFPILKTPEKNIEKLKDTLEHPKFGCFDEVKPLIDKTASIIQKEISAFFKNSEPEDTLLLYYVGHGAFDQSDTNENELFLTGTDTTPQEPDIDSISKSFIFKRIKDDETRARNILVVIDACYSGRFTKGASFKSSQNVDIITSTGPASMSYEPIESEEGEFSYFTGSILSVLAGGSHNDSIKSHLYSEDLFEHSERVAKKNQRSNPQRYSNSKEKFHISKNANHNKIPEWISFELENPSKDNIDEALNYLKKHHGLAEDPVFKKSIEKAVELLLQHENSEIARQAKACFTANETTQSNTTFRKKIPVSVVGEAYLDWLIDQHAYLKLTGIHDTQEMRGIELDKIYVALRGEKSSSYEKLKAREQSRTQVMHALGLDKKILEDDNLFRDYEFRALENNITLSSLEIRDKLSGEHDIPITLGEAFSQERYLVILGDPGSGKTTLSKWIALQMAKAYRDVLRTGIKINVEIPENKIDPYTDLDDLSFNLGPARFPILIRIAEYARAYEDFREIRHTVLKLKDYLGKQKWQDNIPEFKDRNTIPEEDLKGTLLYYLEKNEAIVLLDGMDEVSKYRNEIVNEITDFIDEFIAGQKKNTSGRNLDWAKDFKEETPGKKGGNQVVITSRIVGYHLHPISKTVTHVTIEPMKMKAIERFCDMWMEETHKVSNKIIAKDILVSETKRLKDAIRNDINIKELATNPLLVTIIALVFRKNNGVLPRQRSALYQESLRTLAKTWKDVELTFEEIEYVLSAVARKIHIENTKGLIEKSDLQGVIERNLFEYRGDKDKTPNYYNETVKAFVEEINNKVGVIAPRGKDAFGFIHLTFQEYLAARYITRNKYQHKTPELIAEYLDDPRWKVPLLMALGHISIDDKWDREDTNSIFKSILDTDSRLKNYFPRSALLLAQAFTEIRLDKIDNDIIEEVVVRLLEYYQNNIHNPVANNILRRIERSFSRLKKDDEDDRIEKWIVDFLSFRKKEWKPLAPAITSILVANRWFGDKIIASLYNALPWDNENWNWIIHQTIQRVVSGDYMLKTPQPPSPPLTPKAKMEEKIRGHLEDLQRLYKGELFSYLEGELYTLKRDLPSRNLQHEISKRYLLKAYFLEITEILLELSSQVLSGQFEKDLETSKEIIINLRVGNQFDAKAYQFESMLNQIYRDINNSKFSNLLNSKIQYFRREIKYLEQEIEEQENNLKYIINQDDFGKFKNKILALTGRSVKEEIPKDYSDALKNVLLYCNIIILDDHDKIDLGDNVFSKGFFVDTLKIKSIQERLERIKVDSLMEENILKEQIENIKEEIRSDPDYDLYRIEVEKYNYALEYYERNLEVYENRIDPSNKQLEELTRFYNQIKKPESFDQYKLFCLLLGGYKFSKQALTWKQYENTAVFLQKTNAEKELILEQNPKYFYGKFGTKDPIYQAALSLDSKVLLLDDYSVVNKEKTLSPVFSTSLLYLKPDLTINMVKGILEKEEAAYMHLEYLIKSEGNPFAELINIFTQDTASNAIKIIETSPKREELITKLKSIQVLLTDPVFCTHQLLPDALKELSTKYKPEYWFETYRKLHSALIKAGCRSYPTKHWLDIAPSPRYESVLLADHWYTTSIIQADDRVYEFAVMLDTCLLKGKHRVIMDAFLQLPIAPTYTNRKYIDLSREWTLNTFLFNDLYRPYEIPIDVLTAIENFDIFDDLHLELSKGFKECYLARLIEEVPNLMFEQKLELILFCLKNNLSENGLELIIPLGVRNVNYINGQFWDQIQAIEDPYFKTRALLRFIPFARKKEEVLSAIKESVLYINDPFEQVQLLILVGTFNIIDRQVIETLLQGIIHSKLTDPRKRIKAVIDAWESYYIGSVCPFSKNTYAIY